MKEWKYLIGSADDFIGAPGWASVKLVTESGRTSFAESFSLGSKRTNVHDVNLMTIIREQGLIDFLVVAQRTESFGNAIDLEFCKANPDHPDCKCKGGFLNDAFEKSEAEMKEVISSTVKTFFDDTVCKAMTREVVAMDLEASSSKYNRPCKGITLDIYDVLQAFTVTNPATQHAIKKLLCAGLRGHKDKMQDLTEALKSIERAIELEKE